ncbi:ATP-binding protein [Gallaecimonas kandeliae]|uniref:ATP-binding protein n=1 Tax=Gallaecimonas kandeliae TaxID=3029055 RepID=UPI002649311E|nr:ATP-binding protein [Gallaecimonas kandeliae]WKE67350.1 ATP-binding protein [Gallaecimonas kandeliae]
MDALRILYLEDNADDVFFVTRALKEHQLNPDIIHVTSEKEFVAAIDSRPPDMILSDHGLPGFSCDNALALAQSRCPEAAFVILSGAPNLANIAEQLQGQIYGVVSKNHLEDLVTLVRDFQAKNGASPQAMRRLVDAVQALSLARDLDTIMSIVRLVARELTGADGATFVLRDGDQCHYAEENAISPLWKGMRFPMSACISGWVMLNRQTACIEDIYADPRIPGDAYKPTFVKSLVMVPIRTEAPIGAIGNYWAKTHKATDAEIELLQALANTTAVAMENVQVYQELESRVETRTRQLAEANKDLKAFSYTVSHDLQAPLRAVKGFSKLLTKEMAGLLDKDAQFYLQRIISESDRMEGLIEDMLQLSQLSQAELDCRPANLGSLAADIITRLQSRDPEREVVFENYDDELVECDVGLITIMLENLLANAWKYSAKKDRARIAFSSKAGPDDTVEYALRDNGAGFDMQYADKLFAPFQRLHDNSEFEGTGIGLATVQRIISKHGGTIRAEGAPGQGATFYFRLPRQQSR